ncbi:MAG: hypothetical protein HQ530_01530 [Parcubacteria group bacterium]|nr:hypothetical protein [Parcubacteria group bacterium]
MAVTHRGARDFHGKVQGQELMLVETVVGQIYQVIGRVKFRIRGSGYRLAGECEIPAVLTELEVKDITICMCCKKKNPSPVPCLYIWKVKVDSTKVSGRQSEGGSYQLIPLECWQLRFAAKYGDQPVQSAGQSTGKSVKVARRPAAQFVVPWVVPAVLLEGFFIS